MSYVAGVLAPGTTVAGYKVEALIGRGGMGAVYRAREDDVSRVSSQPCRPTTCSTVHSGGDSARLGGFDDGPGTVG